MTRKAVLLLLCLALALPLVSTGTATAVEEEEGHFTASTPDGKGFESAMPGPFDAIGGAVKMDGGVAKDEGEWFYRVGVGFTGTYSYDTGEVSGNTSGSYLLGMYGRGWSRYEGDEGEWSGKVDPKTGKGSGSYKVNLIRDVHPGPNFSAEVADPYSGTISGTWETTFELYPAGWVSKLPELRARSMMKVYQYMKEQAKKVEKTCPTEAKEIDEWADTLKTLWFYEGSAKNKEAYLAISLLWPNSVTIYGRAFKVLDEITFQSDPTKLKPLTARTASMFIHEMRHLYGYREYGAYTYEWKMFKCLGVDTGSKRYKEVQSQLSGPVGAKYNSQTDTWDTTWYSWMPW